MKKLPDVSLENKKFFDKLDHFQRIIDSGDMLVTEVFVEHREDNERIMSWLERLLHEKDRNSQLGKYDAGLLLSIDTLVAHIEYDKIYKLLIENDADAVGGYTVT